MLMCWNEQPLKRPTFAELRSRFDAMLLADKNEHYIDLRIDQSKLYYQLVTSTTSAVDGGSNDLKKNSSSDVTLKHHNSQNDMECGARSKSPVVTLDVSGPGLKSRSASCMDQSSSRQLLSSEHAATMGRDAEARNGTLGPGLRDRMYENAGRPVSMYLSGDRKRERQNNPYVDEPSRMAAATSLTLSNTNLNGHPAQWSSDGAIEMNQMDGYVEMRGEVKHQMGQTSPKQNGPEIKISFSED